MGRGKQIKNPSRFNQSIIFEGLKIEMPTQRGWSMSDIDFEFENGAIWVKTEVKKSGQKLGIGQRLLIERFCDNLKNYKTYGFLLWHDCKPSDKISISECKVHSVYHRGCWHEKINQNINFLTAFLKIL